MQTDRSNILPTLILLIIWGALSTILAQRGVFVTTTDQPPIALLLSVVLPLTLFAMAYALSGSFKTYVLGLDLRFLTAIQAWRVIGGVFLVLMSFGLLPGTFAWPAGAGDLIVGIYAPFVVMALIRQSPNWRGHVVLLSVLGLLDLAGALFFGVLSGNSPIGILRGGVTTDVVQRFPLSLIPTFGVPAWIIAHIISLLQTKRSTAPGAS
jgi:hypothetical protein